MKKWLVGYLIYLNDQWQDLEVEINAIDFETALFNFVANHRRAKIIYFVQKEYKNMIQTN